MTQTKKCIRCGEKAALWSGYVLKRNNEHVLAGWCSRRCMEAWRGYCGPFRRRYGKEEA